jgi:hypothetical protein
MRDTVPSVLGLSRLGERGEFLLPFDWAKREKLLGV